MKFEKWQALGNDYVIVEQRDLPWELSEERIRRICPRTPASDPTGSCCSRRRRTPSTSPS